MADARNMEELKKMLMPACKELCEMMANEVYEAVNYFLAQYYSEWTPSYYSRTLDFLHSAFKTEVKQSGDGFYATVGIDYESLSDYEDATGFQVVSWSNEGKHGGMDVGTDTHVWNDAMESTIESGQLLKDCILFLKGKGFTIIG